ncbi:hypothetical protein V9L05_12845 [Bernardetia sp. Wsw4-3y2]|uniref:hypothetical protein n=1 Tax=Bernardetia sp. Wsw4-3y2 TaxID=3127471 RepID=UPI0030D089FE
MNEIELKKMWQNYDAKLNQNLAINKKVLQEIKLNKANKLLSSISTGRIISILIGIVWILGIDSILTLAFQAEGYFLFFSLLVHSIITKIAIGISIYHLILIKQINETDSIIEIQKKIANFRLTTLTAIRLSLLQLPIFTTFYINSEMISIMNMTAWVIQILTTLLFSFIGIWCFLNFTPKNSSKKWFRFFFSDKEWLALQKADTILEQLKAKE